jgi:protein-disulfide isomerase
MSTYAAARLVMPVDERRDHIRGPIDAAVTLVEYGDFECPYCGQAHLVLNELAEVVGDSMRLVFRNFPLATIHPHAELAAEAAEAADAQSRYWEMHDILYENQHALDERHLASYADALGLDLKRFVSDLSERRFQPRVREDFLSGVQSGVNGTPTFFINDIRHDGGNDLTSLLAAIQEAML